MTPTRAASALGITYNGPQRNGSGEVILHVFTDPQTTGSFSVARPCLNTVMRELEKVRERFGE